MKKALFILGQLNDRDTAWMIDHGTRRTVSSGSVLIKQGADIDFLFVILNGLFTVVDEHQGNKELARLGSGEIVGEMSYIDARPPAATVRAVADGMVLALPRAALSVKLDQDNGFGARFYRALSILLSYRLRDTMALYGGGYSADIEQSDVIDPDELGLDVLDNLDSAGSRFEEILRRLGASG